MPEMTSWAVSWALDDEARAALIPARPEHEHKWGMWFTADTVPGHPTNRYQRRCKCGAIQYGRDEGYYGRKIRIEKG